jgi:DNA-binding transcriptional MerR regulator
MKIGELARGADVTVHTIRFYERRGVLPTPTRQPSGYRTYTQATAVRIRLARELQSLGFSLDEVIDALHAMDRGATTCAAERWRLEAVLGRIDGKIHELGRARGDIMDVLAACDSGRCRFFDP